MAGFQNFVQNHSCGIEEIRGSIVFLKNRHVRPSQGVQHLFEDKNVAFLIILKVPVYSGSTLKRITEKAGDHCSNLGCITN
jgi:hypothetical protein